MKYSLDDSIVAIATTHSNQALSIIRCSGKRSLQIVSSVFSSPDKLRNAKGNTTHVGYIVEENKKIDQVVVCIYREPKSFTGEDVVEIIAHGSFYTTVSIYNLLVRKGFRPAEKGEFSFRAFYNGKINLTQAEGIRLLSSAKTETEARLALSQVENKFFNLISCIKDKVLRLIAMLDVSLEYPEDEMELDVNAFSSLCTETLGEMMCLLEQWKRTSLFVNGANVVIAGRANAGKSSLFNSLLNEERSIVSDVAGTTRDYIDGSVLFNGLPCRLYDSAGLRHTKDKIEALGVEKAKKIMQNSHLVLYLVDGSIEFSDEEFLQDIDAMKACKGKLIVVLTKKDIAKANCKLVQSIGKSFLHVEKVLSVSVKMNEGIEEVVQASYEALTQDAKNDEINTALISQVQKNLVESAKNHLQIASTYIEEGNLIHLDLVMEELQETINYLGEITGEVRSDDVLQTIFSQFCVGK